MKICDFDAQFLSDSYISSTICSKWHKNMSFNSLDPDLYDHEKDTFIHPVINAQCHAKVGLPFLIHPVFLGFVVSHNFQWGSTLNRIIVMGVN